MKLKNLLAIAFVATAAVPAMAQYEGTQVYDRIGHGNDSTEVLNNLSMFSEYYKAKSWKELWKVIFPSFKIKINEKIDDEQNA